MSTVNLPNTSHAYFDSTMGTTFTFPRPPKVLIITVESGTVNMSLDGGTNFMSLAVGTHQFDIYRYRIDFSGGGVFSGYGVSL